MLFHFCFFRPRMTDGSTKAKLFQTTVQQVTVHVHNINTEYQSILPYILGTEKMQMLSLGQPTFSLTHGDNSGNETHDHILTATQNKEQ